MISDKDEEMNIIVNRIFWISRKDRKSIHHLERKMMI